MRGVQGRARGGRTIRVSHLQRGPRAAQRAQLPARARGGDVTRRASPRDGGLCVEAVVKDRLTTLILLEGQLLRDPL